MLEIGRKIARNYPFATPSVTGIKKPLDNQGVKFRFADRTASLNLVLIYLKMMKPSNIKGLSLYSSHLNRSKLTKIGGSSYTFCYTDWIKLLYLFVKVLLFELLFGNEFKSGTLITFFKIISNNFITIIPKKCRKYRHHY